MPRYKRFEDVPAWKTAMKLADEIDEATETEAFHGHARLRSQMKAAAVSIHSNFAEGFERRTRHEFISFIYIALGSCGELRSQLHYSARRGLIPKCKHNRLRERCLNVSRQLRDFASNLRDSDWKNGSAPEPRGPKSGGNRPPRKSGSSAARGARKHKRRSPDPLSRTPAPR